MTRLIKFFAAPVFEDQEKTRIAGWLQAILLTVLGAAIALPVITTLVDPRPRLTIHLLATLVTAVSIGLLILLHRGYIQSVGLLLSLALWASFTVAIYSYDGVRDVAISGYFFVIILVSLLLHRNMVFIFGLASLLAIAGVFFFERSGMLTVSLDPLPTPTDLITITLALILSTLSLHLAVKSQRAAHQALRQERKRMQQYLDVASVMLLALDKNGRVTLLNRRGCHTLGYDEGELIGQDWFQTCLPARIRDEVWRVFTGLMSGQITPAETFEQLVLTQSGQERIIHWHNALLRDETGQVTGTLSSGQDITERKQADEARYESEQRYRAVAEAAVAGIGITDADECLTYVNPAFAHMLGYTPAEMTGMNLSQLTLPAEFERFAHLTAQRKQGSTSTYETRLRHRDGHFLHVLVSASPLIRADGSFEGTLAVVVNITDQVQVAQELQERKTYLEGVLDAAPDAIVTMNADQQVVEWNPGAERLFGYTAQEAAGRDLDDLVTRPEVRPEARHLKQQAIEHRLTSPVETVRYHKDGTPIDVSISGGPILVDGELIGMVAVYDDITARKQAERALKESQERLLIVLDGIDAHIYVADMDTYEVLFMNRLMRQDFGDGLEGQVCWQAFRGSTERCPHCTNEKLLDADGNPTGVYLWEGQNPLTGRWYANYDRAIRWVDGRMVHLQIATDITERKQAEEEVSRLAAIIEQVQETVVLTDLDANITYANPYFEVSSGYSLAEALGRNPRILKSGHQDQAFYRELWDTLTAGETWHGIFINKRRDGSLYHEQAIISPIKNAQGRISSYAAVKRDVTRQIRAERELEERRVYLEGVLNAAPDAIVTLDASHRVVEWNRGAENLFQYTAAEAVGRNLDDLINAPQTIDLAVSLTTKVLNREPLGPLETVRYRRDGSPVDVILAGAPIVVGSELIGAVGVYTDITRRKLAEMALQALNASLEEEVVARTKEILAEKEKSETILRSVGDAIGVSTPDLKITYVNDAFTALTGYTDQEAIGQPSNFVLAERFSEVDWQTSQTMLAAGEVWRGEAVLRRKDGRTYEAAVTIAPLRDAEGQLTGYISSHRDISSLKGLQRARRQFLNNVSHELRTPVANIKLYAHLLAKTSSPEKITRHARVMREQSDRLEALIQDVIEITTLDSGQALASWQTLSLSDLIRDTAQRYLTQMEQAGLTLEIETAAATPLAVKGDPARLSQALGELIENALTFTPAGGYVSLRADVIREGQTQWAALSVQDTGPGISPEEQERVFERFYRGSLAESGHVPGTGLGLSIAQAIAQAHGGQITVKSGADQGSTFTLWLRLLPADSAPNP
ncbi:MAG: PAS domain-containing sensor histidine kinase [Chloroflexota bacterium]